ncbi:zinc finger, CCHC-type containing protein [Tanacetum coccineum]
MARTILCKSKSFQVLRKVHESAISAIKPGNTASDVYKTTFSMVEKEAHFITAGQNGETLVRITLTNEAQIYEYSSETRHPPWLQSHSQCNCLPQIQIAPSLVEVAEARNSCSLPSVHFPQSWHSVLYLQIVASIEQYSDLSEMTLEEAIGRLKTYEERIKYKKGKQVDNQEKLMFTRHENKGKYFRGRGRGKHRFSEKRNTRIIKREERKDGETSHRSYNKNNFKKSNYDTSKLRCYKCKEIGHIAPKCPQKTKSNEQSNLVEEDLEPTLLMAILLEAKKRKNKMFATQEDVDIRENKDLVYGI